MTSTDSVPAAPSDGRERLAPSALRPLFLFEKLDDGQLEWLSQHGWVEEFAGGSTMVAEGDPADIFAVSLAGTVAIIRQVGPDEMEVSRTDQVGAYFGATQSYVSSEKSQTYVATVRAVTDCRCFLLTRDDFAWAIRTWFPMAIHLLEGIYLGIRTSQQIVSQRQRLLALGALSAGLTHELNNPAAAAMRATAALRERVAGMRHKLAMLAHGEIDQRVLEVLVEVQEDAVQAVAIVPPLTAYEASEREDELLEWLDDHQVPGGWDLAPIFVGAGTTPEFLDKLVEATPAVLLDGALRWLAYTLETEQLLNEITDSISRISNLLASAKEYSHLDRAAYERADLHGGLDSTLAMLGQKLKGLDVVREYDRSLPPVPAYVAELNQVWTNLIDNAVQAMSGQGTLTIRTLRSDDDQAQVEVEDTGPGIAKEIQDRIFEPFFTTKPVGEGTGLGLDISYRIVVARHGGNLSVRSEPGRTCFVVKLPFVERVVADRPAP